MSFWDLLITSGVAGLGATAFADLVAILRQGWAMTHGFYRLVGRWVLSLPRVGAFHDDIRTSPPVQGEAVFGWAAHVILGALYGSGFALVFGASALDTPRLWQGLVFGLATVLVPWLIIQPLFGWGLGMSKAPDRWKMRSKGVLNHVTFGFGLWLSLMILTAFD